MTTSKLDKRDDRSAIHPILRHNVRLDRIVYLPIEDLKAYGRKLRKRAKGAIEAIEASINAFGIVSPILIDQHGTIIVGEAIVEAAKRAGYVRYRRPGSIISTI